MLAVATLGRPKTKIVFPKRSGCISTSSRQHFESISDEMLTFRSVPPRNSFGNESWLEFSGDISISTNPRRFSMGRTGCHGGPLLNPFPAHLTQ